MEFWYDLSGEYAAKAGLPDQPAGKVHLPGTLDEGGIGQADTAANQWHPDQNLGKDEEHRTLLQDPSCIMTRFTRKHVYTGEASYTRRFPFDAALLDGKSRFFLKAERTRKCEAYLNGEKCPVFIPGTLSSPYVFEVTHLLKTENELTLVVDNAYKGWPASDILYSSAATDETQTNWNGVLGEIGIYREEEAFVQNLRILPIKQEGEKHSNAEKVKKAAVEITAALPGGNSDSNRERAVRIEAIYVPVESGNHAGESKNPARESENLTGEGKTEKTVLLYEGTVMIRVGDSFTAQVEVMLPEDLPLWDSGEGNLFTLQVSVEGCTPKSVLTGYRTFGNDGDGHFALNGRRIFLRAEANCCVFPETGHMPLTIEEWRTILETYKSYGVNTMRFHSHFPPEAAFAAADELGMLMMPELSDWNPKDALETDARYAYYELELKQILLAYGNHPSFVSLTFGNELHCGELGIQRLKDLLEIAHKMDPSRMYADGSNNFYGQRGFFTDADPARSSDFYTASDYYKEMIRGTSANMQGYINNDMQGTDHNFDALLEVMRRETLQPVIPHEVGQFEVLPDFHEIELFQGVTIPANLMRLREIASERGFLPDWDKRVAASGELALLSYREEAEAALRTKDMGGISLLGLQDFPGQGTALVGMLNSHLHPKPYDFAKPERFAAFFRDCLPLFITDRLLYTAGETVQGKVELADYGKDQREKKIRYKLEKAGQVVTTGDVQLVRSSCDLTLPLPSETESALYTLVLEAVLVEDEKTVCGSNTYKLWAYPKQELNTYDVVTCVSFEEAKKLFAEGRKVLYCPPASKDSFPDSIGTHFTTDFWSVGTFAGQEGFMGILTDASHPIFAHFPTEEHADRQWWNLLYRGRAFRIGEGTEFDLLAEEKTNVIDVLDSYAKMRHLSALMEYRRGEGRLIICSFGLLEKQEHPEVRAFLQGIYDHLA